jgi:hypothetical protein
LDDLVLQRVCLKFLFPVVGLSGSFFSFHVSHCSPLLQLSQGKLSPFPESFRESVHNIIHNNFKLIQPEKHPHFHRLLFFKYLIIISNYLKTIINTNIKLISYYIYITISLLLILNISYNLLLLDGLDGLDMNSMSMSKGEII